MLIPLDPDPKPCTEGLSSALVPDGLSANPSAFYPFSPSVYGSTSFFAPTVRFTSRDKRSVY